MLARREARPSGRDHQWERASPMGSSSVQRDSSPQPDHQNTARREDIVLVGGVCCVLNEPSQQEEESGNRDSILDRLRAVAWSPDVGGNAFDIQVGMERPAEMALRSLGEVLMENTVASTSLRRADFEQWGLSQGCPGCRHLRTGQVRQQAHSEACRKSIEGLLEGDSVGVARLAAVDERINRALADAVERHATNDPGTRDILKRASVVCDPKSEPGMKIALDTEQDLTPHPPVSYGSSGSGTRPSDTASNDPNTGTR